MTRSRFPRLRALLPALAAAAVLPLFLGMAANRRTVDPTPVPSRVNQGPGQPGPQQPDPAPPVSGPVTVTLLPAAFSRLSSNDQIVREFAVQNNSSSIADVYIRLNYNTDWHNATAHRSVATRRQIPPNSRQVISLFLPTGIPFSDSYEMFSSAKPEIYVNGRPYRPQPTGINDSFQFERLSFLLPSSFSSQDSFAKAMIAALRTPQGIPISSHRSWENEFNTCYSDCDTIQWPAVPQFYQNKDLIFRKTTDAFTPDAEEAIRDAVMLGATEILAVSPGTPWPSWAPRPEYGGAAVVIPRGFGRTIVIEENGVRGLTPPTSAGGFPGQGFPPQDMDARALPRQNNEQKEIEDIERLNPQLFNVLRSSPTPQAFNPSALMLVLPSVKIPSISFAVVLFALLAYIVIVGPVNYYLLNKKKKSILLLLLTVPVISLIFVAVVIVFVAIFEGWYSRASAVGVTFLDQTASRAYTRAAVNLYAPVPVRTLRFDTTDTVSFASARDVEVSLGREQVVSGMNRARIPMTYGVSRAEKRMEQLKVSRTDDGSMAVMNGLGAPVKILALRDASGQVWTSGDSTVAPGANFTLRPLENVPARVPGSAAGPYVAPTPENTRTIPRGGALSLTGDPTWVDYDNDGVPDQFYPGKHADDDTFCPDRGDLMLTMAALLLQADSDRVGRVNMAPFFGRGRFSSWISMDLDRFHWQLKANPAAAAGPLDPGMYLAETDTPLFYTPGCKPLSFRVRHLVVGTFTLQESAQ